MAQSILVYDFGTNEETARQARHKIEAWQQGSRLGKKILLKFDRRESTVGSETQSEGVSDAVAVKGKSTKGKVAGQPQSSDAGSPIRIVIRLDFSEHEKLTQQRWLDRFASEEPFKSAKGETLRQGNPDFAKTVDLFDSLD